MGYHVVEGTDALGLLVAVVSRVDDVPVPQSIIRQDVSSRVQDAHHHLVSLDVGALVAIHESQVEHHTQFGCFNVGIADAEINLVGNIRTFNPGTGEILHLVVDFEGVELAALLQSLGKADGAVATEGAHLKNILGADHLHQHLEQSALDVPARHTSVDGMDVGGTIETVEIIALRLDVLADIFVDKFCLCHLTLRFPSVLRFRRWQGRKTPDQSRRLLRGRRRRCKNDGGTPHACVHSRCEPLRKGTSDCGCNPAGQCWYGCRHRR